MPDFVAPGDPWAPDDDVVMEEEGSDAESSGPWSTEEEVDDDEDETQEDAERRRGPYAIKNVFDYTYAGAEMGVTLEHGITYLTRHRRTVGSDCLNARVATNGNAMIRVAMYGSGPICHAGMRRGAVTSEGIFMDKAPLERKGYVLQEIEGRFIGPDNPGNYHYAEDEAIHMMEDWAGNIEGLPGLIAYADGANVRVARIAKMTKPTPEYELADNAHLTHGKTESYPWIEERGARDAPADRGGRPHYQLPRGGGFIKVAAANRGMTSAGSSVVPVTVQPGSLLHPRHRHRVDLNTGLDTRIAGRSIWYENRPRQRVRPVVNRTILLGCLSSTINGKSIYAEAEAGRGAPPGTAHGVEILDTTSRVEPTLSTPNLLLTVPEEADSPLSAKPRLAPQSLGDIVAHHKVHLEDLGEGQEQSSVPSKLGDKAPVEDIVAIYRADVGDAREAENPSPTPANVVDEVDTQVLDVVRETMVERLNELDDCSREKYKSTLDNVAQCDTCAQDPPQVVFGGQCRVLRGPRDVLGRSTSDGNSYLPGPGDLKGLPDEYIQASLLDFERLYQTKRREKDLSGSTAVDTTRAQACPNCKHVGETNPANSQAVRRRFSCPEGTGSRTILGCGYPNCTRVFGTNETEESDAMARRLSSPEKVQGHQEASPEALLVAVEGTSVVLQDSPEDTTSEEEKITSQVFEVRPDPTDVRRTGRTLSQPDLGRQRKMGTRGSAPARAASFSHHLLSEERSSIKDILTEEPEDVVATPPTYEESGSADEMPPPYDVSDYWRL